jgi:cytochrome c oxidase assembly protein subunit 15
MTAINQQRSLKPVATWLLIGVVMIIVQVILGGITRLTGSGLSITEWNVITGTLPPLNEEQWIDEFDKYKQTRQFALLNADFTIRDFKFIFFWEWFHRLWARLIGVVFIIPFVIFLIQKRFRTDMVKPMIILFLLGALQGAVGWIMVASGLTGDAIYVRPTRLALHFLFALGLLCYTLWFALQLLIPGEKRIVSPPLHRIIILLLFLLSIQLVFGALMAGHKAATSAPTWPDINGAVIPPNMFKPQDGWFSLIENTITIHFIHRLLAYLLVLIVLYWTLKSVSYKSVSLFNKIKWIPLMLVLLQTTLGIFSVLVSVHIVPNRWGVFEWLAFFHQLVAMLLLLSLIANLYLLKRK